MSEKDFDENFSSPWVEIKDSKIHGKGVFAKKDIPKGTQVIEYVGENITKKESDKRADIVLESSKKDKTKGAVYIFELNKKFDIDGNVSWNQARYINHSCDSNCESEDEDGHIWVTAMRDIKQGEEISYNYGYDLDDYEDHHCKCGSKNCAGFIIAEKYVKRLKKKLSPKTL